MKSTASVNGINPNSRNFPKLRWEAAESTTLPFPDTAITLGFTGFFELLHIEPSQNPITKNPQPEHQRHLPNHQFPISPTIQTEKHQPNSTPSSRQTTHSFFHQRFTQPDIWSINNVVGPYPDKKEPTSWIKKTIQKATT